MSTLCESTDLQFGKFHLSSEEGAQQGDPLGPLYFCLAIKNLLDSLESEMEFGYLDDLTIGGDTSSVAEDFIHIQATAANLGLILNCSKCEIVSHTVESRDHSISKGILLKETYTQETVLLGSPLFEGSEMDQQNSTKLSRQNEQN